MCKNYSLDCKQEEMTCEGCAYNKKSADEMFEELGYRKIEESDMIKYFCVQSTMGEKFNFVIMFLKNSKLVQVFQLIDIREIQAINKKVEELGWI